MIRDILDDFCCKHPVDVRVALSMSSNDIEVEMFFNGTPTLHRDFTIYNFPLATDEEMVNLLESLYEQFMREVEDYLNTVHINVETLGWMKAYE